MQCKYSSSAHSICAALPNYSCTAVDKGNTYLCHEGVWLGAVQDSGEGHMLRATIGSLNHFVGAIPARTNSGCWVYTQTQNALEILQ